MANNTAIATKSPNSGINRIANENRNSIENSKVITLISNMDQVNLTSNLTLTIQILK